MSSARLNGKQRSTGTVGQAIENLQGQDRAAPVDDRMLEAALRGDAADVEKAIADGASVNVK